ncbi:MAG: hypothetical protein NZ585_05960 [Chloracidobacterium sp.]|nr:hypothetical protein [Chloracidobacterium sp.]MDW8216152.1 hypothetical protein [Acidobacteriota bacterium]
MRPRLYGSRLCRALFALGAEAGALSEAMQRFGPHLACFTLGFAMLTQKRL